MLNKNIFIVLIASIFLISLISADLGTFKQGECVELRTILNSTSVSLSSISYPNGTVIYPNTAMTANGKTFNYTFCGTDKLGEYIYDYYDVDNAEAYVNSFQISPDGKNYSIQIAVIQIIMILFFICVGIGFYYIKQKVNFEQWYNKLFSKYENKNYVKLVIGSIGYNIMKNSFVLYYLIGLPIIVSLTHLAYIYDLTNLVAIFKTLTIFYFVGAILVGILFLSYLQEWFMDLLEKVRNMEWGIE